MSRFYTKERIIDMNMRSFCSSKFICWISQPKLNSDFHLFGLPVMDMDQEVVQIKSLSCQASTLTMVQNQELARMLLEEMKSHSKVAENAQRYLGTLLLLLDPLLDKQDDIKEKMQHEIDQYKENNN